MIDKDTYKKMMAGVTPERLKEAYNVKTFVAEKLDTKDYNAPDLSEENKNLLICALLIEYGKQKHIERT